MKFEDLSVGDFFQVGSLFFTKMEDFHGRNAFCMSTAECFYINPLSEVKRLPNLECF